MRREAQERVAAARGHIGRFTVQLDHLDAEFTVDGGVPVFDGDGLLLLDAGMRRLVVRAQGRVQRETVLEVQAGERGALGLAASLAVQRDDRDLLAEAAREAPEPTAPPASLLPAGVEHPVAAPSHERPFPWLAAGAFGAAAISGVFAIVQFDRRDDRITAWKQSNCRMRPSERACSELRSGWHSATTWGVVSLGLMGAFTATGVLLLVLQPGADETGTPALACSPLAPGFGCALRM
jgi:hypothetical protein